MKISDYRADYYFFTGKVSEIVRQLALAGIAVVWIFKETAGTSIRLPTNLLIPCTGFLFALGLDLLQYVFASIIWKTYYRELEAREVDPGIDREEHDFGLHDASLEQCISAFFWAKIIVAILSWCMLVGILVARLLP